MSDKKVSQKDDNRQSELGGNDTPIERQLIVTIRAAAWIDVGELGCSIHTDRAMKCRD